MGDKYIVYLSKYPYKGYREGMQSFDKFNKAIRFAKKMMKRGYDIIDIQCRDIKEDKKMSKCNTCEYSGGCKEETAHRRFEQVVGSDCNCSGFKQEEDKTSLYEDIKEGLRQALAYEKNTWVITENGCVITCPKCGERLELCYPDGTEVRYLPHCPWCGKKLEEAE